MSTEFELKDLIKDGIEKVFEKAYAFTNEISIDDF